MNNFDGSDNIGGKGGGQSDGVREGLGAEAFKPPAAGETTKLEAKTGTDATQTTDNVGKVGDSQSLDNAVKEATDSLNKVDTGATEMMARFDRDPQMKQEQKDEYVNSCKDACTFFGERATSSAGTAAADLLAKQLEKSTKK